MSPIVFRILGHKNRNGGHAIHAILLKGFDIRLQSGAAACIGTGYRKCFRWCFHLKFLLPNYFNVFSYFFIKTWLYYKANLIPLKYTESIFKISTDRNEKDHV